MRKMRKLLVVLLAVIVCLTVCAAVFAEAEATPAPTAAPEEQKSVYIVSATDANGKSLLSSSMLSCLGGSGSTLYIKNEYTVVFGYVNGSKVEETDDQLIVGLENAEGNATFEHNTLKLGPADKPYTLTVKFSAPYYNSTGNECSLPVVRFKLDIADLLVAAIGIYVIYSAIRGGGALFSDEFIKEDKKDLFKKLSRTLCIAAGAVFIISAAAGICFSYLGWVKIARYVLFGVGALCLIALILLNNFMTDKEKRDKAQQRASTGGGAPTSAAFEFDGTEPTLDEVLAEIDSKKNNNGTNSEN